MKYQDKIYGAQEITEPVILELLKTPQLKRLKEIHQSGIYYYAFPECNNTRFEHSVGVMLLLKRFGTSLDEQVAGLLHDISHGAFSHVIDYFYGRSKDQDHQDSLHINFFNSNLKKILTKYNLDLKRISDLDSWPLLDQPLPDICADRLDYTLRDGYTIGQFSLDSIKEVLADLKVENNKFIFGHLNIALQFANLSHWLCSKYWHVEWGEAIFLLMIQLLRKGLEKKIITEDDFYTDDETIMKIFEQSNDSEIIQLVNKLKNFSKDKVVLDNQQYDFKHTTKLRVIDPLIEINNELKRVSEVDIDFKNKYNQERERVKKMYLRILE